MQTESGQKSIHIVGGGIMGLTAAIELAQLGEKDFSVHLYEGQAFGGGTDERTAGPRCQGWFHRGTLYATNQPDVTIGLQKSTARLEALAPQAFSSPLALFIEPSCELSLLEPAFRALDVQHRLVANHLLAHWFPALKIPSDSQTYRIQDGVIDLRLLAHELLSKAITAGVHIHQEKVIGMRRCGSAVEQLNLGSGITISIGTKDQVILANGARIRQLLLSAELEIPGLRVFQSHMIATDSTGIPALLAVSAVGGGTNCLPHWLSDGTLINVFANSHRQEITDDQAPIQINETEIAGVRQSTKEWFGLDIPQKGALSWAGLKTEIITEGTRSQAHHARTVPGVENVWVAIPGKLSQTALCAQDLARHILRRNLVLPTVQSIWESMENGKE